MTMPFLSFLFEEQWQRMTGKQRTRAREGFSALSAPSQARKVASTRRGYVDDVAGKAVGLLTDEAEQAVARYEKHVASARVVPPEEGEDGALFMTGPEGESEEDLWAGAGFDEGEQEVQAGPDRGGFPEPAQQPAPRVVNLKHSVNMEAQVKALQEEAAAENDYIDRAMQALGMRQHAGKMENVLCTVGKGARAVSAYLTQKGALTGSMLEASRYLGTRLTRTGTFSYEREVRLQATRAGWLQFGKYWQSRSPFRQRRSLFKGVVQGAALSGLETATGVRGPLTPGEVAPIDRLLVKYGRALLRGTAKANAEGVVRAVPNVVIWRRLRLVPTFHELRYRRVAWAQQMSENVREHDAVLTGLMGQFAFETQSTVAEDGSPTERANPWVQQLFADVLSLLFLESAVDLRKEWDRSVLSLFGKFAESFRKIDLNEARATHWSVAISPGAKGEKTMKPWRTSSVPSGVILSRQLGRRVDSPLRHGAGSLHIKDDLQGARTVFDIWLRFSLSPTRVYYVARPARASGQRAIISSVQSDINDAF